MIKAAALVKRLTTGWEMKFTTSPSRKKPSANWKSPTKSERRMAYWMKAAPPAVAVISDTTATGRVASWRLDPNNAATMGGRKAA